MRKFELLQEDLKKNPKKWLVTGAAGFIGSHLTERLLNLGQKVIGLDNLSTGHAKNIELLLQSVPKENHGNLKFIEGDIRDLKTCQDVTKSVDYVLHQAALGSVPRSIEAPINSHESNVNGALNMFWACHENSVSSLVYASSSSVYGDSPILPKEEKVIGKPLSPYAGTKLINEIYADIFSKTYGLRATGLRYFNVFGPRQDPNGPYAAVIPRWVSELLNDGSPRIFGDGTTSRDFCFIENVIEANLLAAVTDFQEETHRVFNIALHNQTSLVELFNMIRDRLATNVEKVKSVEPKFEDFRKGDVKHSLADISYAKEILGYEPVFDVKAGIEKTVDWFYNKKK